MIPLEEAQARVLAACRPKASAAVALDDALGLVLAEAVVAADNVPPFANSAMDGFAVRAGDLADASAARPARLRVIGTIAAGAPGLIPVGDGQAVRIMTGAPFPPGADAVAIVETTRTEGDDVLVSEPVVAGAHIRPVGEDLAAGQEVFPAGVALGAGHLGVLASAGRDPVPVVPSPVVGVLSTGDELVEGSGPLQPGQIRDSNRRTLLGLLRRDGFRAVDLGIARDDEGDIRRRLEEGAQRCDAILTSGGVSMGDFDFVKKVLDDLAAMAWMQIAIRPAKPFAFGAIGDVPIFGLPGNPVSSMVSYELLARPGLRRMAGHPDQALHRPLIPAVADDGSLRRRADGRTNYTRVLAAVGPDGRYHVRTAGGQASNLLWPMAVADALAVVPPGPGVEAGGEASILLLHP
ncbi:molybdopterin molybdotransferase MoeA [Acidiferrimicrobium sp. IK]|uniref:molybdopterin molybdotransferase MoeA n=1 Tax=Acidiferrimicrobium sp. IK TaxID=2871700 RepID=UPI0021CB0080|nr:gephyrin-like molybdotransferase Glp [Acidiferrimicrobium sp. IK]MCU4185363.1 molybdopterin molybdotransferase MoeA [Acidiferrimicrobium sp. IK]